MKKKLALLGCLAFTVLMAGCRSNSQYNDVVKETYFHKYGVPVAKADWETQGKDGQIMSLRKDGVTVSASYNKGILDGPATYSFPNSSTIQFVETYSNAELVSKKENYPSGVPMREEIYEENALMNLTRWYEDGTPQANELYQNTFLASGEYRTPLNVVESRIVDGHGTRVTRSNEGDLLAKDFIQNGQMVERVTYYANGDPATVTPFANGVVHGARLTFLQGGLPNTVEQWVQGVQEGTTIVYLNGEKISEVPYVHGIKNGIEHRFRDGELLVEEITWKGNAMHGQRKVFVDGQTKVEWYHNGELVSRTAYERMNMPRKAA
jgi:antitoxin component YwqK of YwqJK toxin-antitoxin module